MSERLQKVLASAGYGSRRQIEDFIRRGEISVDEQPAELGTRINGDEQIRLHGQLLDLQAARPRQNYILRYYKPVGEICSRSDPQCRPTIFQRLPKPPQGRWISIGRLDINSEGLLLLTTDGQLAHRLMHPATGIEREYAVRILGQANRATLNRLRQGVVLNDGRACFSSIRESGGSGANRWYTVTLREGRNRIVRRLWQSQGFSVSRLLRIRYGPIELPRQLACGQWELLPPAVLNQLYQLVDQPGPASTDR